MRSLEFAATISVPLAEKTLDAAEKGLHVRPRTRHEGEAERKDGTGHCRRVGDWFAWSVRSR